MGDTDTRRRRALAELTVLIGDWAEQVDLSDVPAGRMSFEWALDGQYLVQRSDIPEPSFPDSLAIIAVAADGTGYTQHYFDSRGVVRTYAMTLEDRTWTLLRDRPDFTPLNFAQRFTGTFSDDGETITAVWERSDDSQHWRTDFTLTYTRIPPPTAPPSAKKGRSTP
jgi:hypothetical protein